MTKYKGHTIDFNTYGKNEYTVFHGGNDFWFETLDAAKKFIDEIETRLAFCRFD